MSIKEPEIVKFQKDFGKNLKHLRLAKNLTQLDLAVLVDMETTSISRIENGRTNITLKTIYKLSNALEVSCYDMFNYN